MAINLSADEQLQLLSDSRESARNISDELEMAAITMYSGNFTKDTMVTLLIHAANEIRKQSLLANLAQSELIDLQKTNASVPDRDRLS